MENIENTQPAEVNFTINSEIKNYLVETSKWGKLLAIVGYIGIGLLVLMGLAVMVGFSVFSAISHVGFPMGIFGLIYIVIALLYFFPVNYLYKFSSQMKHGLTSNNQQSVTSGFGNLKSLFKFMGIMTIVVLSLWVLMLIIAVPLALFTAGHVVQPSI